MEKSLSIQNIAKAIITFHIKVDKVRKDAKNPFFKSTYASLSNILEAINEPLIESGLSFVQFPTGEHGLMTLLMHADSGEFIQSDYTMKPAKDDPQGRGSAITYQRRYALSAILGLNIDDDDDGNSATHGAVYPKEAKANGVKTMTEVAPEVLKQWTDSIEGCKTIVDLTKLFKGNEGTINSTPQIFKLFSERKKTLLA